jgi:hypothetical protein
MRFVIEEDFILDDSGFVIGRKGNLVQQYIKDTRVYIVLNDKLVYMDELVKDWKLGDQWRRTKYLKSKERWRAECPKVKSNKLFKTHIEAAVEANNLAEGSDFIPNQIPLEVQIDGIPKT